MHFLQKLCDQFFQIYTPQGRWGFNAQLIIRGELLVSGRVGSEEALESTMQYYGA